MQTRFNEGLRRGNVNSYNAAIAISHLALLPKLLTPDKRYSNAVEGDGASVKRKILRGLNGIAMVPDKDMRLRIAMLRRSGFKMYELAAMEFADETGSMYIAQSDVDALEVRVRQSSLTI